jgi:hypothetical protein
MQRISISFCLFLWELGYKFVSMTDKTFKIYRFSLSAVKCMKYKMFRMKIRGLLRLKLINCHRLRSAVTIVPLDSLQSHKGINSVPISIGWNLFLYDIFYYKRSQLVAIFCSRRCCTKRDSRHRHSPRRSMLQISISSVKSIVMTVSATSNAFCHTKLLRDRQF